MNRTAPETIKMKKWMRKSTINFFGRNKDAIGAPSFVPLCNKMVVDVMTTGFEVITRDTHFITCRARQILANNITGKIYQEDDLFKAETELNTHFENTHEFFDSRIQQGEQKLEMGGFSLSEIQRLVTNYETITVTNGVTQYLDILAKADHYLTVLQYLWVTSELSDSPDEAMRVKLNCEREVRQVLFNMTRISNLHYNNIRRLCSAIVEKRQQERAAQSERDKARNAQKKAEEEAKKIASAKRKEQNRKRREQEKAKQKEAAQQDMNQLAQATA